MSKTAYSVAEAAESTGLSQRKIRELIASSELHSKKYNNRLLIPADSLQAWLDSLPDA
ncbi:MAG: helix-turn-helix domain-containing protein [Galactobacter sp.]